MMYYFVNKFFGWDISEWENIKHKTLIISCFIMFFVFFVIPWVYGITRIGFLILKCFST